MLVSIVIPTLNAGPEFASTLQKIRDQDFDGEVELVVVDSESRDDTVRMAHEAGARVRRVLRSTFNHGFTRNLGAALTRGEWIAFLTQDAEPCGRDWLTRLVESGERDQADGVYCRVLPRPDCSPLVERSVRGDLVYATERLVKRFSAEQWEQLGPFERRVHGHFNNVASMVRRETFARCPYPEIDFGEDLAWGVHILGRGGCLVYEPAAEVLHSHASDLRVDFLRHQQDARLMRALFGFRNRDSWRDAAPAVWREWRADWDYLRRHRGWSWSSLCWGIAALPLRVAQISGQLVGSYGPRPSAGRFAVELPQIERIEHCLVD